MPVIDPSGFRQGMSEGEESEYIDVLFLSQSSTNMPIAQCKAEAVKDTRFTPYGKA